MIVAFMLIGPIITDSLFLIFMGLALNGVAIAGVFVPVIPELVYAIKVELVGKVPADKNESAELLESDSDI